MTNLQDYKEGGDIFSNTNPTTIVAQAQDSQNVKGHNKPLALT